MALSEAKQTSTAIVLGASEAPWHNFLLSHPETLPYHHPAWLDTLADAYGYEPRALVVRTQTGEIAGGVPLVELGGRLRPRRWVSLPFTDFCPPLLAEGVDERTLCAAADELRRAEGVSAFELRGPVDGPNVRVGLRGVRHVLELGEPETLFGAFRSQVRRNIRKAEKAGLTIRHAETRDDLVRTYFALHSETRRRLGVPPQPRQFFDALWRHVLDSGLGYLLLAYHRDVAIAGAVFLEWNGCIVYKYGASDRKHWSLRPNNLLFWECIRRAWEKGARKLDFGRSDLEDQGLRTFKESWGAQEEPLSYTTLGHVARGSSQASKLARPLIRASPVWIGRLVGTKLYRLAG
jgi:CelD/BcsL family acetyltransferase involved in cellulose biosynthesis